MKLTDFVKCPKCLGDVDIRGHIDASKFEATEIVYAICAIRRHYAKFPHKNKVYSICNDLEEILGLRDFSPGGGVGNPYYDKLLALHAKDETKWWSDGRP